MFFGICNIGVPDLRSHCLLYDLLLTGKVVTLGRSISVDDLASNL